ncbi:3-carboxy-cis,cis-muconate cycloisomerase [Candidimonas nitroreducens]|uniref:3-carboxy-cis,cis-muconate cycloisomerase n=1 Tax=Candidimonas nitroreducens TaxID=683354 RepID=A0A225MI51_9BURK|nr:3-carboxy-cis,cis-muconate cycloisomerase [Candidimonas nitroreducens]OWT60582.1 3-carboxy-cis,cis-muconate cycloisomerase [Candidimonas nitroreducens]
MELFDPLFRSSACAAHFGPAATLQGMLDFEAALAHAQAAAGVIPQAAVAPIEQACRSDCFDAARIAGDAARAGNLAIPLVKQLTARVRQADPEAARYVHWGATSQDAIDTGMMLQLKAAFGQIDGQLAALRQVLAEQAERHRDTVMVGRTWLQHALPITFGLKLAGTLDAVLRLRAQLHGLMPEVLCLQFGGAAGTLASLGERGPDVAGRLAERLGLTLPDLPWHGQRDRIARAGAFLGTLAGTLGKLARDVSLLAQTDVGEVAEAAGEGRGGSSTMPHKRNPVGCAVILAAAARAPQLAATLLAAMPQEHERGLGGWHAEWETLPELALLAAGALDTSIELVRGLEVHEARMRQNLGATQGLIMAEAVTMALGASMGRLQAHGLVEQKCRLALQQGRDLQDVLAEDQQVLAVLGPQRLAELMAPQNYLGAAGVFVDRVLQRARADQD